ncbi:thiamine-phosphate diphosphorylase [candidate division WOR-1 bacterium RIFOXYC2_FULL_37_10]|uniref:Thiamine-phosphate synthase n=1 Tax=candidate division WOR-1 bacterium RIFOXYB2_FULL_37_13 TaxID=1802579 RepID=A0A1F4SXJ0_UNCSA|nr:MAG: thiamine-phosphate diphosphorylase [candidate division WOR-1 bacterium RIFOXYB2_FULL_37_13]OGC36310.1 MAG: thiamine-phosphate diphosphorylase [candidate division WOR-1 bacterium RIFOXYC2_FULL_37_10]
MPKRDKLALLEKRVLKTDIYPVITPSFCKGRSPIFVLQEVLAGGAKIVQLRDKQEPERHAQKFREITEKYNALLIINDSVDLALKFNADGVHLGQGDLPLIEAREKAPELIIGVSAHNLKEALFAQENGASYVNLGPIFQTKTKEKLSIFLGVAAIKEIAPCLKIPFTVMGGINKDNIDQVLEAGARRVAMVTGITETENVAETVRFLARKVKTLNK